MKFYNYRLATKTYLKKYLHSLYGDPLILDLDTPFGDVFLAIISGKIHTKLSAHDIDIRMARYTDEISVRVPMYYFYLVEKGITIHHAFRLNRYFNNMFETDFCQFVRYYTMRPGTEIRDAIEAFATLHGIELEVDISFEALKKKEYRFRMEQQEKNRHKNAAALSLQRELFLFG